MKRGKKICDTLKEVRMQVAKATGSFKVGLGVKTEGNLVISGTKGYAYVPAPWWKTDFFELRYENQNNNKKYFYSWNGEGLRIGLHGPCHAAIQGRQQCEHYLIIAV